MVLVLLRCTGGLVLTHFCQEYPKTNYSGYIFVIRAFLKKSLEEKCRLEPNQKPLQIFHELILNFEVIFKNVITPYDTCPESVKTHRPNHTWRSPVERIIESITQPSHPRQPLIFASSNCKLFSVEMPESTEKRAYFFASKWLVLTYVCTCSRGTLAAR